MCLHMGLVRRCNMTARSLLQNQSKETQLGGNSSLTGVSFKIRAYDLPRRSRVCGHTHKGFYFKNPSWNRSRILWSLTVKRGSGWSRGWRGPVRRGTTQEACMFPHCRRLKSGFKSDWSERALTFCCWTHCRMYLMGFEFKLVLFFADISDSLTVQ